MFGTLFAILLLFIVFCFYMAIKGFKQKRIDKQRKEKSLIYGKGFQFLESIYIIDNSKNDETIKSRIDFVLSIYGDVIFDSKNKNYETIVNNTVERYNEMYYNKPLNFIQIDLLLKPNLDKLKKHII